MVLSPQAAQASASVLSDMVDEGSGAVQPPEPSFQ
jgi:hypothetical protein